VCPQEALKSRRSPTQAGFPPKRDRPKLASHPRETDPAVMAEDPTPQHLTPTSAKGAAARRGRARAVSERWAEGAPPNPTAVVEAQTPAAQRPQRSARSAAPATDPTTAAPARGASNPARHASYGSCGVGLAEPATGPRKAAVWVWPWVSGQLKGSIGSGRGLQQRACGASGPRLEDRRKAIQVRRSKAGLCSRCLCSRGWRGVLGGETSGKVLISALKPSFSRDR
jgi:hypothetical protein